MSDLEDDNAMYERWETEEALHERIAELEQQLAEELKRSDRSYAVMDEYRHAYTKLEEQLAELREAAQDVADQRGTFALWSCSEAGAIRAIDKLKALLQEG